ncbi:hypothetical protein [Flagellimonas myxillae]|uniref:hypothetical protein n=1 Tax=Flagellimonas myxillae TaxID=2942214 RepID=UPI00201F3DD4|nr:hypothetical protein [Muricauda myxillae]MCL6266446.1 hypothetical protein [Muricauda myxillae]
MRYIEQMKASSKIKWYDSDPSDIQKLVEKGSGNKQLYVEVVTYGAKDSQIPKWKNKVSIFVFDLELTRLLYLNEFEYNCDPRDSNALEKVIHYGLNQLKDELGQ